MKQWFFSAPLITKLFLCTHLVFCWRWYQSAKNQSDVMRRMFKYIKCAKNASIRSHFSVFIFLKQYYFQNWVHSKVLIHSSKVELSSFTPRFHKSTSSALQYTVLNLDCLKTGITVAFVLCIGVKITNSLCSQINRFYS